MEAFLATSLLLICTGPTAFSRSGGFADGTEPLDDAGVRDAALVRIEARFRHHVLCSPWRVASDTASVMELAALPEPALADMDPGRWAGHSFEQIESAEPGSLSGWIADPTLGAPEGETMPAAQQRIGRWLDGIAGQFHALCAITHPMMIRAAVAHALDLPLRATLAIDIAPLSRTMLSFNRTWRLQSLGCGS